MRKVFLPLLFWGGVVLPLSRAEAKTVALWPMEFDERNATGNLRCMIDPANDMSQGADTYLAWRRDGAPWALPPNPDTDRHVYDWNNSWALWSTNWPSGAGNYICRAESDAIHHALSVTNDFTLEGWINVHTVPDESGWFILANARGGSSKKGGWIWSMRCQKQSGFNPDFELYVSDDGSGFNDKPLGGIWFTDLTGLTNVWMHVAMVHRAQKANNKSEWAMYTNGVLYASVEGKAFSPTETDYTTDRWIELGGRNNGSAQRFKGGLDYWRLSDVALAPSEFLCAGGEGTAAPVDPSASRFHWPLDRTAQGTIDVASRLGQASFSSGFPLPVENSTGWYLPSLDAAFEGQPPNTTVALPGGNAGSFFAPKGGFCWRFAELGRKLEVDQDFTVEGWFKPRRCDGTEQRVQYMFNTRISHGGWALGFQNSGNRWCLQLFAQQTNEVGLAGNAPLSGDLSDWSDWKHVALVYDHAAGDGRGVWTTYLDGKFERCHTNNVAPSDVTGSEYFHIGGRVGTTTTFHGGVDCVRVTARALAPNQLLCATKNPQAVDAADVLGFWPLDCSADGLACNGKDLTGQYSFADADAIPANRKPASVADAPTIPNPDATWIFAGGTNLTGATAFNCAESENATHSYLLTSDKAVQDVFHGASGWTAECYVKRTAAISDWEIIFGTMEETPLTTGVGMKLNFTYRSSGFVMYDNWWMANAGISDTKFPDSTPDDLPVGAWKHVALVCSYVTVDEARMLVYEVFVDGVSRGTVTSPAQSSWRSGPLFVLGGRPHSGNSFKGYISSVRLSARPLSPAEFLCAPSEPQPAVQPVTWAMWSLDWTGNALDLGSRVTAGAHFLSVADASGSSETARARVPRADETLDFIGDPKQNTGSVTLGPDGYLSVNSLGSRTETDTPFTIEGWVKWVGASSAKGREMIVGNYRHIASRGWRLYVDTTGATPALCLFAAPGYPYSPLVGHAQLVADVSSWKDAWKHIALVYDPKAGKGIWTCYVDGKVAGSTENLWAPQGAKYDMQVFGLGTIIADDPNFSAFAGGYDMWRLSFGALTPEEFLYKLADGSLLIIR